MIVVHDEPMDRDWQRLGKALQAARRATAGKPTQEHMADALGVSRSVIQNIERGVGFDKPTPTIREYARKLGWAARSVDDVLAGGEPTSVADEPAVTLMGLPTRVARELTRDGDVVDTVVIQLPGGGSAVVVVKDQPDATPEERERTLEAWLRAQPKLRSLDQPDTEPSRDA
jgi:DNA-binding XRE family transcriptional regulator